MRTTETAAERLHVAGDYEIEISARLSFTSTMAFVLLVLPLFDGD